jgi:hypothetical protein
LDSDEVDSDSKEYQSLSQSKIHRTGKAPRQRTIIEPKSFWQVTLESDFLTLGKLLVVTDAEFNIHSEGKGQGMIVLPIASLEQGH